MLHKDVTTGIEMPLLRSGAMAPGRLSGPLSRPARCVRDNSLNIPLYCASLLCEEVMSQGAPELFSRAAADVGTIYPNCRLRHRSKGRS